MFEVNLKKLKPYGDRMGDGSVQISFTLPVKVSAKAKEAAKEYAEKLNLEKVSVVAMEPMGEHFTYFVVYGSAIPMLDFTKVKAPVLDFPELGYEELKELMNRHFTDPIVVVGACTGTDAHTVGIDAILNMKGFAGDYGLERYPKFKVYNLRAQLSNEDLIKRTLEFKADALLVSQVVTQRDSHIKNLKELKELLSKERKLPSHLITIIGGPRIDHALATKLGFDAGFGSGTKPSYVASFIIKEYLARSGKSIKIEEKLPEETKPEKKKQGPKRGRRRPYRGKKKQR